MTKAMHRLNGILVFLLISLSAQHSPGDELQRAIPTLPQEVQVAVNRALPSKPGDTFVILGNGLALLVRENPGSEVVSARVVVKAGSIYEGKTMGAGLSHYLEHIVSGGTTRSFTEDQAKERLQRMGGTTNAMTTYDRTTYYINTTAGNWKDALDLLLAYVSQNVLDPGEVTREKSVIQQEIKMGENSPDNELWKLYMKTAYRVHPLRHPIIGYEEVFVQQGRESLLDYYLQRYQPENMTVVVAGGVKASEVIAFTAEKIGEVPRRSPETLVLPEEPTPVSPRREEREMPIARLTQAIVGFPSVSLHERDLYALDVLSLLMGEGETSRLNQRLKDREKKVLRVSASNWTPSFARGQFMISLTLPPQNWPGVMDIIHQEIDRFKKELVGFEELEKVKKSIIAQRIFGLETVSAQASSLASSYFDTGDPYYDEVYVEGIRQVTPEEIREVARRYLVPDRLTVAAVHPPGTAERNALSQAGRTPAPKEAPVERHRLKNGLKVFLRQDTSLPLVTIKLYGIGGLLMEDPGSPGISAFTASLLTAGTRTRSKLDIANAVERVGGALGSSSDNSTYHVVVKVLKEDLDLALDLLADVVQNPVFPNEEIEKKRQETLLALQRMDESWQAEIVRMMKQNYFTDSPYRNDRIGTVESVKAFTRENIVAFHQRMVNPNHSVVAVYGDVRPEQVLAGLEKRFQGWKGIVSSLPNPQSETSPLKIDRTVEKKNEKSSSALLVVTNGLSVKDSDRPVLDVMDAVLSGAGNPGGRLFDALRGGKEDLVYVVGAFPFYGIKAGYFAVITQTTLVNLEKVQGIILENLRRLREEPVSTNELETAKNMIATAHRMGLESLDAQAQSAVVNEVLGLGWDYDQKYVGLIQAVTPQDVQRVSKELLTHALIVRTIPEKPVEILAPPPQASDIHAR